MVVNAQCHNCYGERSFERKNKNDIATFLRTKEPRPSERNLSVPNGAISSSSIVARVLEESDACYYRGIYFFGEIVF